MGRGINLKAAIANEPKLALEADHALDSSLSPGRFVSNQHQLPAPLPPTPARFQRSARAFSFQPTNPRPMNVPGNLADADADLLRTQQLNSASRTYSSCIAALPEYIQSCYAILRKYIILLEI